MLYADYAGIVSRSSEGLERMMTVIVTACSSSGLTVSGAKTEIMCLETKGGGQVYKQTIQFVYLVGVITADKDLSIEITRRLRRAWACFQRYKMEIYDRSRLRLRLKVRLLKAEVVDTLLNGCMTWSPKKPDYVRLRRVHRCMLLRCLGWRKRVRDDHTLSYGDALAKKDSESVEAIVRKRRILLAGFLARIEEERLPQRVMFREFVGGKDYSGGQEKDWMGHLIEDMSVFGINAERLLRRLTDGFEE